MIGQKILHYNILAKLGAGGMGIVYKAFDTRLKREVAIKLLPRSAASTPEDLDRLKIEAQAAAALNHPNIATIHAIEEFQGELFIVMEYVSGRELREMIDTLSEVSNLQKVLDYAAQIAEGLQAAHKKGVVHRDIKSSNVMIAENDQIKIMDFGLAKIGSGSKLTKAGTTLGTLAYMSPEQIRGEEVDHRTDIWSWGVVLYELLSGKSPFDAAVEQVISLNIINEEPESISNVRPDVDKDVGTIVETALQKNADDRYQEIGQAVTDLRSFTAPDGRKTLLRGSSCS
jgi:serine/threonine protein kinase